MKSFIRINGTRARRLHRHHPKFQIQPVRPPLVILLIVERRAARNSFIDFVSGLLRINPFERWTPRQALQHPFLLDAEWTGPFTPPADKGYASNATPSQRSKPQPSQPAPPPASEPPRQSKIQTTYDQPQRYEPTSFDQAPQPAQPPQIYYSPRHNQALHSVPTSYLSQIPPHYIQQPPPPSHGYSHNPQVLGMYSSTQDHWGDPHTGARAQHPPRPMRDNRPRANTIGNMDSIPLQIRQATARIDPTQHQIRPSPAYYPPHDIEGILTDDGMENSTSRNIYAMQGGYGGGIEAGMRPRKKSQGQASMAPYHHASQMSVGSTSGSNGGGHGGQQVQPQGQGQMLVPPQQNLFRGSARALEDGLMPPWQ